MVFKHRHMRTWNTLRLHQAWENRHSIPICWLWKKLIVNHKSVAWKHATDEKRLPLHRICSPCKVSVISLQYRKRGHHVVFSYKSALALFCSSGWISKLDLLPGVKYSLIISWKTWLLYKMCCCLFHICLQWAMTYTSGSFYLWNNDGHAEATDHTDQLLSWLL